MTLGELKEMLAEDDLPDDTEVVIWDGVDHEPHSVRLMYRDRADHKLYLDLGGRKRAGFDMEETPVLAVRLFPRERRT